MRLAGSRHIEWEVLHKYVDGAMEAEMLSASFLKSHKDLCLPILIDSRSQ